MIVDDAITATGQPGAAARGGPRAYLRTARPLQWIKNLLVFAAPGAAGVLDDGPALADALLAFVACCLASSGLYFWNDVLDVDSDRRHPVKRLRPIPTGLIGRRAAAVTGSLLVVAGCGVAALTGRWQTAAIVAVYAASTMAYSVWLKQVAVVDLVVVASGFVLRAAAGAAAVDVEMSSWFVLFTVFGSLFIVSGKRYAELRDIGDGAAEVRRTLGEYTPGFLRLVVTVSCAGALLTYCQWAFETKELSASDQPFFALSIVPMLTALLRYALVLENGRGAAPEEVFASDRVLQLLGVCWVVLFALGVYLR
jgi:decaprenyl-phosphate phosphoribosyltransferase